MTSYSNASKILHHLALNYSSLCQLQFDIERTVKKSALPAPTEGAHVFVCGMARAGTTILMRSIFVSGEFASLTYRDMPFVLAPNLWASLQRGEQRHMEKVERAHGDGIQVGYDSPEALEEVYWRVHGGDKYLLADRLVPHDVDEETLENFKAYVSLILTRYQKSRYLSKNNNNILRIDAIRRAFPNALLLIPFRDPRKQALSLLAQHKRFLDIHRTDAFSRRYMTWLAHHEFGADHRPFDFGSGVSGDTCNIDYWLARWNDCYSFLLQRFEDGDPNVRFVCYEDLCSDDPGSWENLCRRVGLPQSATACFRPVAVEPDRADGDPVHSACRETYERARRAALSVSR
jgi:hypothetical protein